MHHDHQLGKDGKSCCGGVKFVDIIWWAKLVIAVLAIPGLGIILALGISHVPVVQVAIMILTCWACTYLGMKLMNQGRGKD